MSFTLKLAAKAPFIDYSSLIASTILNNVSDKTVDVQFIDDKIISKELAVASVLVVKDQVVARSPADILKYLSDKFPNVLLNPSNANEWLTFANDKLLIRDFKKLSDDLETLEQHLDFHSFIIGYDVSLADIAVWGALRSNPVMGSTIKNSLFINITRWYQFLETLPSSPFSQAADILSNSIADLKKKSKSNANAGGKKVHKANFEINLPGAAEGKVVTRFPPEPSGYLHIGHAKAAILNEYFAHEYKGKLILRFDDTNPSKEKMEFEQSIIDDLKLLGISFDMKSYSSDYFDEMYDLCVKMIKDGKAYCDDTPLEQMRAERMDGIASSRRDRSVEENLEIFTKEMKNATEIGLKNCVRAKIDYKALNKTLRDPVVYRCNLTPHHRTGSKWKMYPTYDFCVPILDSLEGVTHALRTIEYRDRNAQYAWMQEALGLRSVYIWDFARVNFIRTLLSKRKLQWFVDKGYVGSWEDPRFPTVRGIRRRGMTVEGLRNFVISQGPSRNIINLDWNIIWSGNKKVIDPIAPRHTALATADLVELDLVDVKDSVEQKPKHKKNPAVGLKNVYYSDKVFLEQADAATVEPNEEVTLMDWGNVIITDIQKDSTGKVVLLKGKLHLEGDFRKTSKKLTWLDSKHTVNVTLKDFDHLITKDKLDEGDNFEDYLTPNTEFDTKAIADVNVKNMKKGDIIQFERKGYYILDEIKDNGYIFFTVPDGKSVNKYGSKA